MKSILQTKILMIVTAICVVGYIAFGYFFPETGLDNLAPTDRLNLKKNIVVLGVDERSDDVGRSDTLFVVMFDSSNKSASLLSVPRDTRVRIDGHGWDKINHAYAYGGRELTQKTVEELLILKALPVLLMLSAVLISMLKRICIIMIPGTALPLT